MSKDCYRSHRVSATCARCGQRTELTHMPTRYHGFYCDRGCCPACHPQPAPALRFPIRPVMAEAKTR